MSAYTFAYLVEQTKRMIRRAILKGLAMPGCQVPFASREMPMPYGWGAGGVQVSAATLTPEDTLTVIDQGADGRTNAVSIRKFFENTAGAAATEETEKATVIQTRHRIPEAKLRQTLSLRRDTLDYVSQFLRVVPRVPLLDDVAEPLLAAGCDRQVALGKVSGLLKRLNNPERLWILSATTFSGGEKQRVSIARGFAHEYSAMLLDEPTASLDAQNRETVLSLIEEAKNKVMTIVGIFQDFDARERVCDREVDVSDFTPGIAA
ncbi:alpha-D-ribose 1-methylphosphonate 5-phosphate C-P-lyase PhnJ [uncultured Ruegeria sp.]|uniref:alpha-D-ribose 1-methylphosphonate 5-phosphate C-P-lyase PhnJ n=1 Tax=uncultured Ruegeria sp. TaxID=259304 RepID=UPI00260AB2BB|nr:alpha-D-ribose 1-methylphosphonate 5-phosphate C-P-lyase PhnJ [uncultured Ruegeria sp.]